MFFTRSNKTLRVWFAAVTSTGNYRNGLTQASFTAEVVNPTDTAQVTSLVSESAQRPGVYYFDVPASFLTTHGIGDYMVSVKIDSQSGSSGTPQVKTIQSNVVHVTFEDFDSLSGSIWNTPNGAFNTTGTMGHLLNLVAQVSGNVTANSIASAVWNAVASSFNTSGTMGWIQNQLYLSSAQEVTTAGIVSGVWNANAASFNSVGTFGAAVNESLADIKFHMSSTFVASASILSIATSRTWISTSLPNDIGQFDGMLLMVKSPLSGAQIRVIDTFRTGTFDVDPGFTFGTASDSVYVMSTQFVPGRGYVG
jgi:hypothetical protein